MILLTGATGFIGKRLVHDLIERKIPFKVLVRKQANFIPSSIEQIIYDFDNISSSRNSYNQKNDDILFQSLKNIDICIHLAAKVNNRKININSYIRTNCTATIELAKLAKEANVKRFIFMSSVKVNGESTKSKYFSSKNYMNQNQCKVFREDDLCKPEDDYARSKYYAEQGLFKLSNNKFEVVIIRPPMVYDKNINGNLLKVKQIINLGIPLPFLDVDNQRSIIALSNLSDFIIHCLDIGKTKNAANEVFLIADSEDISLTDLLKYLSIVSNRKIILFKIPVKFLIFILNIINKKEIAQRLFGNLRICSEKAKKLTGWVPKTTVKDVLEVNEKNKI